MEKRRDRRGSRPPAAEECLPLPENIAVNIATTRAHCAGGGSGAARESARDRSEGGRKYSGAPPRRKRQRPGQACPPESLKRYRRGVPLISRGLARVDSPRKNVRRGPAYRE